MAVTRSWEATGTATARAPLRVPTPRVPAQRKAEFWLLVGASLVVAAALSLTLRAKTEDFASTEARLRSGVAVNLNSVREAAELRRWMDEETASAVMQRSRPIRNVGALRPLLSDRLPSVKPSLIVRTPAEFQLQVAASAAIFFAAFFVLHLAWRWRRFRGDGTILPVLLLLTGIGFTIALSIRDPLRDTLEIRKFSAGVAGGCALLLLPLFRFADYRKYAGMIYTPLIAALALFGLLAVFGSGPTGNDSRVNLGPVQPVEAIKVLLVVFFAGYFARRWEWLRELHERRFRFVRVPRLAHVMPVFCGTAAAMLLFFVLRDLGPALAVAAVFLSMYAVARRQAGLVLAGLLIVVGGVAIGYRMGQPRTVAARIAMWLSPWDNDVRGGDQLVHATWAFATGGPWGSGAGRGDPAMIPAGHTDLVLPAFAEEWGVPGVLMVAALMSWLVWRGLRISLAAPDEFGVLLGVGLTALLAFEMLLISGGVLGVIPLTGVVSPFLSSGNTAMLMNFLAVSALVGISAKANERAAGAPFRLPVRVLAVVLCGACGALVAKAFSLQAVHDEEMLMRDVQVYQADGVKRPQHNPRLNSLAQSVRRGTIYDRNGVVLAESAEGVRRYAFPRETAHLIGNANTRENFAASNSSLIEDDQNSVLRGFSGYNELARIVRHRHQPDHPAIREFQERVRDVRTTIDIRFQERVVEALERGLRTSGRTAGAAVVLDAVTGDVLAMASAPAPSREGAFDPQELLDRARYGSYPPGSTFKLVTALAALRKDPALARAQYRCSAVGQGRVGARIPGWNRPVRDDAGDPAHGAPEMTRALTVSCNAYFAQLGVMGAGGKALLDTARLLGVRVEDGPEWRQMLPFSAMGQGPVVASPLQLARVSATVASGGLAPQGRWLQGAANGRNEPPVRIVPEQQARFLADAMRAVVTQGTARSVMAGFDVQIAGKTGTAQTHGEPHAWFTGFAPYDVPSGRIAFAVIVEHGGYGGRAAAPIAREIVAAARDMGLIAKR